MTNTGSYERFFDFGNGEYSDNVIMAIKDNKLAMSIKKGTIKSYTWVSTAENIVANTWYYVAAVLKGQTLTFYLNGKLSASGNIANIPNAVTRKINYLAKSNFITLKDPSTDAIFSNFKIYQGSLSASQIQNDYAVSNQKKFMSCG